MTTRKKMNHDLQNKLLIEMIVMRTVNTAIMMVNSMRKMRKSYIGNTLKDAKNIKNKWIWSVIIRNMIEITCFYHFFNIN
jgi:hypothetical protein